MAESKAKTDLRREELKNETISHVICPDMKADAMEALDLKAGASRHRALGHKHSDIACSLHLKRNQRNTAKRTTVEYV
jgi:hypothetical protein